MSSNAQSKRILVIDDEESIVEFIRIILRTRDYDSIVAYNGEDGLALLQQHKPDLVICDLRMPKMSGLEFSRRRRELDPELASIPLLIISSMGSESDKPDAFWMQGLGCDDFLAKPFDPLSLLGRVEALLRKEQYVSPNSPTAASAAPTASLNRHDPLSVVRAFIEAWNHRDFLLERSLMSDDLAGGLAPQAYAARRAEVYVQEEGDAVAHNVLDSDLLSNDGQLAHVAVLREDNVRGVPNRKDERYVLQSTPDGWQIITVRSRKLSPEIS